MKLLKWGLAGIGWITLSIFERQNSKDIAYRKGFDLSQKFKRYKAWDRLVEPVIIKQFSFFFGVSNAFIKGLISDNEPDENINKSLNDLEVSSCEKLH